MSLGTATLTIQNPFLLNYQAAQACGLLLNVSAFVEELHRRGDKLQYTASKDRIEIWFERPEPMTPEAKKQSMEEWLKFVADGVHTRPDSEQQG